MKYEPLKGKVYHIPEKGINVFLYSSVKSAVRGLLQEIENRIKELDRYEQIGFTKQFYINCTNRRDEIETRIIPLIKKWFADVVEEDEE